MSDVIVELMQRDGFCRSCDKELKRNVDPAIKFYSYRGRGMNILLCLDCVDKIHNIKE